jgi:formylmethanofuran dehydrogenase subunit E
MTQNRDAWFSQIKKDYPNVPNFVVDWMLDIHENNPDYFKQEMKKQKGRPKKASVKTTLSNLNSMADEKSFELKTVQIKFAEQEKQPIKVDDGGYIKVDFS